MYALHCDPAVALGSALVLSRLLAADLSRAGVDDTVVRSGSRATAHLWIESPLARDQEEGQYAGLNHLFDTHPPLDERIAALREL